MSVSGNHKLIAGSAVYLLLFAFIISNYVAQGPQSPTPSVQASPEPSPNASVTPTPPPRVATPTPLPGAQNAHQWGSVTVFNGLPSDSVRAIAQTPDGVMWFGTDNGLARFDGRRTQKFSLGDADANRVLALETLANGELWVGTRAGAFVYSGSRFEPVESTLDKAITAIVARGDDIWRSSTERDVVLGTESGLVLVVRKDENGLFVSTPLFTSPIASTDGVPVIITGLIQTDHGGILASTSGRGVFFVDDGIAENESTLPVRSPFVNAIVRDSNFIVWLGIDAARGASGIIAADPNQTPVRISAPTSKVVTLATNDHGTWAGTERYGLFNFVDLKLKRAYTFANTSGGLRSDTVYTLFTDREGVLWIGTNRGASRFDLEGPLQETVSASPNGNFIRTVYRTSDEAGSLYAGSNRGLFVKGADEEWTEVPALGNRTVYTIRTRVDSSIIVGTPDGLFELTGRKLMDGDVRGLAGFNRRDYAAVYGRGVVDITGDAPKIIFANKKVTSVSNGANKLWIGTLDDGLHSFDGIGVKRELAHDESRTGTIWNMSQNSADGPLYIAGQHGVFAYRDGFSKQIFAAEDVRDVIEREGHIWAATTSRGLLHARFDEHFGWLVSAIGFEQGLPSEKAFSIQPFDDSFVVGTNRGVVTYKPGRVAPKLIATRILSQRVHDLDETSSSIALDYPQNSLLIEVAGQSSRTFPEEFQYAFELSNPKGEVIDRRFSNEPQYSPQNLPAGDYTIRSVAFDRDLNASEPLVISFAVAKAPFPWTATALGVLLALSLFGLIWAIAEHIRIRGRNRELAAARFDLANEAERERRRIARDLHDQTLADLRNLIINSDKPADNSSFRSEIESVSTEIRRICEDLSPSVLENVGLVAALDFLLSRTVENGRLSADDATDDRITFPLKVQLQVYRIAQEVLTNISKHSQAGAVEVSVEVREPGQFRMSIRDNGNEFQPAAKNGAGRGIANIHSRASLIGANVKWKTDESGWNVFVLTMATEGSDQPVA